MLPKHDRFLSVYASANRDEEHFTRPAEYNHRSNLHDHVAFEYGPRYCLGAHLARIELRVVLELPTTRRPELRLALDEQITVEPLAARPRPPPGHRVRRPPEGGHHGIVVRHSEFSACSAFCWAYVASRRLERS
ncbi:hypothetical protein DMH04_55025 [Kibdelosporangium aridum]|uniref:Cytochrome P450 n=1 Tax=Kibdelosporangium aridum TaxID=2030 RepID=A0A428XXD5_KIBAR|nr:hypothetical protein DMH04_55025 [Kibdelosporangium aridum]